MKSAVVLNTLTDILTKRVKEYFDKGFEYCPVHEQPENLSMVEAQALRYAMTQKLQAEYPKVKVEIVNLHFGQGYGFMAFRGDTF